MQQLVLDLRDNPGGPLDQAIRVASRFLKKDEAVVSTKGRIADADHNYGATSTGGYTDVPMVVLVDRQSASASEIVTGAMQDHDRGLVVGETTFGKALVQTVFSISNGAGLALTTGHYYTPSGRMIQRPWDGSFDEYLTYQFRDQNTTPTHTPAQMHETDSHRKVYEGGGIEPDHFVIGPIEGFNPNRFSRLMRDTGRFVTFAERFAKAGDDRPGAKAPATAHRVSPGWPMTDDIVHEFHQSLVDQHVKMDETAFNEDLPFVKAMIHFEVDTDLFGIEEARRHLSLVDPQLLAGVGYFDEARRLLATRQARK
jgi:carboxyl-terminal processing protease